MNGLRGESISMDLKVHVNSKPEFLYKVFDNEAYAIAFADNGRFRLTLLNKYREIEDLARQDNSEGKAHIRIPGGYYHEEMGNPCYLMCTSGPTVDLGYIKNKFGRYVVKILAPETLLAEITKVKPVNTIIDCDLLEVEYSKGMEQDFDFKKRIPGSKLSICQKSRIFSKECEYRYMVMTFTNFSLDNPSYLEYDLRGGLSYLEKCW